METICKDCETTLHWDAFYDAHYCPECNVWKDKACKYSYPDCWSHCDTRPARPLNLVFEESSEPKHKSSQTTILDDSKSVPASLHKHSSDHLEKSHPD